MGSSCCCCRSGAGESWGGGGDGDGEDNGNGNGSDADWCCFGICIIFLCCGLGNVRGSESGLEGALGWFSGADAVPVAGGLLECLTWVWNADWIGGDDEEAVTDALEDDFSWNPGRVFGSVGRRNDCKVGDGEGNEEEDTEEDWDVGVSEIGLPGIALIELAANDRAADGDWEGVTFFLFFVACCFPFCCSSFSSSSPNRSGNGSIVMKYDAEKGEDNESWNEDGWMRMNQRWKVRWSEVLKKCKLGCHSFISYNFIQTTSSPIAINDSYDSIHYSITQLLHLPHLLKLWRVVWLQSINFTHVSLCNDYSSTSLSIVPSILLISHFQQHKHKWRYKSTHDTTTSTSASDNHKN